jgi:hypothetical protein
MRDEPKPHALGQAPAVGRRRTVWQALVALDVVYLVVASLACVGAVVYAVVHFDAETLIFAVVGLATVFVLGCIVFGVHSLTRRR